MLDFVVWVAPYVGYLFMLGSTVFVAWIMLEFLISGIIGASGALSKQVEILQVYGTFWHSFGRYYMMRFKHVWRDKIRERKRKVSQ